MALSLETSVRNAIVNAWIAGFGANPLIRVYSGTPPANAAAALSGNTLIVKWTGSWAAASNGSRAFNGTADVSSEAFGAGTLTGTFYRIYDSTGTTCYEQGTVTVTGGGGDMTFDNVVFAQNQACRLNSFTKSA